MFKAKYLSKKGGFKELVYDNIGIIIVLVLLLTITLKVANNIKLFGSDVVNSQSELHDIISEE